MSAKSFSPPSIPGRAAVPHIRKPRGQLRRARGRRGRLFLDIDGVGSTGSGWWWMVYKHTKGKGPTT